MVSTKRFIFSSCLTLQQVQTGNKVLASLSGLLDYRFTAITVCLCLSVLRTATSFKHFERCLDWNAWNKNMSTLSVSIQFNRCIPDTHWTMMLLSQKVSFSRHFKPKVLQLNCFSDSISCPGATHDLAQEHFFPLFSLWSLFSPSFN